ncbi:MAG: hypothetical protein LLG02_06515 [Pelosinus sp.]|nr:hypothetical protein [Pelosinus sp.]
MHITKAKCHSAAAIALAILITSCSMAEPVKKPEIGPAGSPTESLPNPPILERFQAPPAQLYDLEATAGVIFQGLNKSKWPEAEAGLNTLQSIWPEAKGLTGEKKGVKTADEALTKLTAAIQEKEATATYDNLSKFMGSIGEIGKSYKLSPLSDLIAVDNGIRNVSFYVEDNDWAKAAIKVNELDGTWGQAKPSLEKVGILGEVSKTHSQIKQFKDAVAAQNKGAIEDQLANINDSMARIRNYYRGK